MPSEAPSTITETPRTTRSARDFRIRTDSQHRARSINPKITDVSQNNTPISLTPINSNKRLKSGRAKPSRKKKKNMAQAQEGITILDTESVDIIDILESAKQII